MEALADDPTSCVSLTRQSVNRSTVEEEAVRYMLAAVDLVLSRLMTCIVRSRRILSVVPDRAP